MFLAISKNFHLECHIEDWRTKLKKKKPECRKKSTTPYCSCSPFLPFHARTMRARAGGSHGRVTPLVSPLRIDRQVNEFEQRGAARWRPRRGAGSSRAFNLVN